MSFSRNKGAGQVEHGGEAAVDHALAVEWDLGARLHVHALVALHLVVRGRAWQDVNRALLTWRSTQPGDTVVAGDVARVTVRLRDLAPLVGDQPDLAVGEQRRLGDVLAQATDTLGDVGRWSHRTLERMGHARQVLVAGHRAER